MPAILCTLRLLVSDSKHQLFPALDYRLRAKQLGMTTPSDVLAHVAPTPTFLCNLEDNVYGLEFLSFRVQDVSTGKLVFEVAKDPSAPPPVFPPGFDRNRLRSIAYRFPAEFLRFAAVATTLVFAVGEHELRDFRMIERHYFKDRLIRSFDFNFNFCIPHSVNTWESTYDLPVLSDEDGACEGKRVTCFMACPSS